MELLGQLENFPGGLGVKNLPGKAGASADAGSIPGLGRSPGEGKGQGRGRKGPHTMGHKTQISMIHSTRYGPRK